MKGSPSNPVGVEGLGLFGRSPLEEDLSGQHRHNAVVSTVLGMVRNSDPTTSSLAAEKVLTKADTGRALVLQALLEHGPCSDFDLARITGWRQVSIGKRRGELRDAKLVKEAGYTRKNEFGNKCQVWMLA